MTTDHNDTRPPHAPDYGFVSRGSVFALCRCGALQIVDPAFSRAPRPWLRKLGWSRPPTNLADPDDGWFCPACAKPADTRPSAHRLTVTPETLRRAEALGFEPGEDDVLEWALREVKEWRDAYKVGCSVATGLDNMLSKAQAERDTARRDLARIVQLCGWDCDGNDPETPAGAIHLYADAVQAVRELVEERAEDSIGIVNLQRLCFEAAELLLNEPAAKGCEALDAMAVRLQSAAWEVPGVEPKPAYPICGAVVSELVSGNVITRTLCPLPTGHEGDHAEALAGGDTDTDRSTT